MKLATLKNGTRDGQLLVVDRLLTQMKAVPDIVKTLQDALDDWSVIMPELEREYRALNEGALEDCVSYDASKLMSPLPRAYQWADGSAYVNHVELARKARGAEMPESFWTSPLMYQGGSDAFIGPCDPIIAQDEAYGIDLEGEIAVITGDVPMGVTPERASNSIRLFMLVNDVSLRNLVPDELAKGFGFFQSKPACSFSPLAITPDELGTAWDGEKIHLPLQVFVNEKCLGRPHAGTDMVFDFRELIAHAAKTRQLSAGTIIGSGTVSNKETSTGSACLAEQRMLEKIAEGEAKTSFLHFGDRVRIEMLTEAGESLFGAIEQEVKKA